MMTSALPISAQTPPSLAKIFEGKFRFGFGGTFDKIVREGLTQPGSPIRRVVEQQSNILGINCFYPNAIHPKVDVWNWETCDQLLAFADLHPEWPRRAHILFWPFNEKSNMEWLIRDSDGKPVGRDEAIKRLHDYIQTVMGRYKGRFKYWDVANEVIDLQQRDGMHKGLWKDVIGAELIELTFRFAREADPGAKLFYNDFHEWRPAKREQIYKLVKGLKDKGLIDGIGLQSHYTMSEPTPAVLDAAITRYAELGLEIHVTELDVEVNRDNTLTAFPPELAEAQAKRYREIFDVYLKHAGAVTAVMTWNVTDNSSWLRNHPTKHATWPLLFDDAGEPKPAFWSLVEPSKK
ncbi:MAG: endo-1,4-beta-xylanase [Betaproteobacteria bacterium]